MRSTTLPARDLWYSEGHINYYYGGQYFAVFSYQAFPYKGGTDLQSYAYLCSRTGFCNAIFPCLPDDVRPYEGTAKSEKVIKGLSFCSWIYSWYSCFHCRKYALRNLCADHSPIEKLTGKEVSSYWFPDATRYIGYNPYREEDRTIHEFPCYSFVLGIFMLMW